MTDTINVGSSANDHSGDLLRNAFIKTNAKFVTLQDDLEAQIAAFMATVNYRGDWLTGTVYSATTRDYVKQGGLYYLATVSHTAGTFATDLAALKWVQLDATALFAALASTGTGQGSAMVAHLAAGAGATPNTLLYKLLELPSVEDFMTPADRISNDLAPGSVDVLYAFTAAFADAKLTGNRKVRAPARAYQTSGSIEIHGNFNYGIEFEGCQGVITCTANVPIISINCRVPDSPPQVRMNAFVRGFTLVGPGKANTLTRGIKAQRGAGVKVEHCSITGVYIGLHGFGNLISHYSDVNIFSTYMPMQFEPDGIEFAPNDIHFTRIKAFDNDRTCRMINFPNGAMTFNGCELEGNNLAGGLADGVKVAEFSNAGKVTFNGCHMEANPGQYNLYFDGGSTSASLNIIGGEIIPGDSCGNVLYMANVTAAAHLFVQGARVTNNVGVSQIVMATGTSALIIGETAGNISGDQSKVVRIRNGVISNGGGAPDFGGMRSKSATGIAYDAEGSLRFVDSSNNRLGYITATNIRLDANAQYGIGANNGNDIVIRRSATPTVEPANDNTYTLGSGGLRWSTVYAATGTINTSDERAKQQIRSIDEKERAVALRLKGLLRAFRFNESVAEKGDKARIHFGVIAQDVKAAFEAEGLVAEAYALLCYDAWEDICEDVLDAHGQPTGEKKVVQPAGNRYGVRYEELLMFILGAV